MTEEVDALLTRARREIDAGLLPSCQVALARHGEIELFEAFGDATTDTRYIVYSTTKAFVASLVWQLIGEGLVDVSRARRRLHPRVRAQRQGRDHRRAGHAPHRGLPLRAARRARRRDPRWSRREDGRVEAQLGTGLDLRVPRRIRGLGPGRDRRPGDRRRLPGPAPGADHRPGRDQRPPARHRRVHRTGRTRGQRGDSGRARGGARGARAAVQRRHARGPRRAEPRTTSRPSATRAAAGS